MDNQRVRILIVDDDQEFCDVVKDYLTNQGFHIDAVHDGIDMKKYLSEQRIDLIILDVMLPGEDGLSLARQLRAEESPIPIIMLSAAGDEVDRVLGLELGADHYLTKQTNQLTRTFSSCTRSITGATPQSSESQDTQ
ncbi:MAG: response regulator [Pseudomonadota bacterium]|nr:response regulator [Pseudomonadota bacterium]